MKSAILLAGAMVTLLISAHSWADTVYTDGTFDPSNYTITNAQTGGGTINTVQVLSGGNPGAALQTTVNGPASTSYQATSYAINNTFSYNPVVSGAITSLSFSADRELNFNGTPLAVAGVSSIIEQNGDFYRYVAPISTQQGVWQTGSGTGIVASDYNLITNLNTGATDTTSHPNFDGTTLLFGVSAGVSSSLSTPFTGVGYTDNLAYDLQTAAPVPLPAAAWLFASGIVALGARARRRKERLSAPMA